LWPASTRRSEEDRLVVETGEERAADADTAVAFIDVDTVPSKVRETLREVFALFDIGGDGASLTADEMKEYLTTANPVLATDREGLARIMAHMDDDNSGEVEFGEFLDWVAEMEAKFDSPEKQEEVFKTMFSMIDEDGGGTITLNELCTKMRDLREEFNPDDVQEILMEVDEDGSGHLDVEEFEVLVNKVIKPETEQFGVENK